MVRPGRDNPDVSFLALSVSDEAEDVIAMIRAGARGYVTKTIAPADLAGAIRQVEEGDAVFSPRLAGFVLDAFAGSVPAADPELDQLTPERARGTSPHRPGFRLQTGRPSSRDIGQDRGVACFGGVRKLQLTVVTNSPAGQPTGRSSRRTRWEFGEGGLFTPKRG